MPISPDREYRSTQQHPDIYMKTALADCNSIELLGDHRKKKRSDQYTQAYPYRYPYDRDQVCPLHNDLF